jgi:hypothetical protein
MGEESESGKSGKAKIKIKIAYINPCRSRVQIIPKRLDVCMIYFCVHRGGDEPANMEPSLDEVRVLGQGLIYSRDPLKRTL